MKLYVRRNWNGWETDEVDFEALRGWRWDDSSGGKVYGFARRAPRLMLMAYVSCNLVPNLPHSCRHGPPPHSIKVVVVKRDQERGVYEALRRALKGKI